MVEDTVMEIKRISEDEARRGLSEVYTDPDSAAKFFDDLIATRREALERFTNELNTDKGLAEEFRRDPLGLLNRRKLIGPFDEICLERLVNPYMDYPWPYPTCHVECRQEQEMKIVGWVFVRVKMGAPIYMPVVETRWVFTCDTVCD